MEDVVTTLREIASGIEEEREQVASLRQLLVIAAARVPEWAGANDEAHEWWMRANKLLEETS